MKHSFSKTTLDIESVNEQVVQEPTRLVKASEFNYTRQLDAIADQVVADKKASILLLAGPSASSKTTTAMKLQERLVARNMHAVVISLDDFYVNRADLPILPDGKIDYETIHTLDLGKIEECLGELIEKKECEFPLFDFGTGLRQKETKHVSIGESSILIIEGLHALNPLITKKYDDNYFMKIYISPYSNYYMDGESVLRAREVRLIRRIIRDYFHRSSTLEKTLDMWENVIVAEIDNVLPFREDADYIIDSTIVYEPCIYAKYLIPLIEKSEIAERHIEKVEHIKDVMEHFVSLDISYVPADTVLKEFLD